MRRDIREARKRLDRQLLTLAVFFVPSRRRTISRTLLQTDGYRPLSAVGMALLLVCPLVDAKG